MSESTDDLLVFVRDHADRLTHLGEELTNLAHKIDAPEAEAGIMGLAHRVTVIAYALRVEADNPAMDAPTLGHLAALSNRVVRMASFMSGVLTERVLDELMPNLGSQIASLVIDAAEFGQHAIALGGTTPAAIAAAIIAPIIVAGLPIEPVSHDISAHGSATSGSVTDGVDRASGVSISIPVEVSIGPLPVAGAGAVALNRVEASGVGSAQTVEGTPGELIVTAVPGEVQTSEPPSVDE